MVINQSKYHFMYLGRNTKNETFVFSKKNNEKKRGAENSLNNY